MAWGYGQKVRPADVKVTFITPSIVRVQWSPDGRLPGNATGVCVYSPSKVAVQETTAGGCRTLLSSVLKVSIDLKTAAITFADLKTGHVLLEETRRSAEPVVQTRTIYDDRTAHAEQTANGQVTVKQAVRTDTIGRSTRFISTFDCTGTRALYGLGSHMEDYMNLLGKTLWLTQHNLKITIPVLVSPQGYGLLFDVGCAMKYASDNHTFTMQMEAARQLDYYFIAGKRPDEVVGGYRYLTGRVEMLPRYAFGYIQSKEPLHLFGRAHRHGTRIPQTPRAPRHDCAGLELLAAGLGLHEDGSPLLSQSQDTRRYHPQPSCQADGKYLAQPAVLSRSRRLPPEGLYARALGLQRL